MIKRGKKAAFEMSMSTIIIIVLSVTFLILGLVLLRNIAGVATKSITTIDDKLGNELQKLFTDETKNLVIYLGEDRTAKIKAGTTNFGILIAAQTINGIRLEDSTKVQYKLELVDSTSSKSCMKLLTKTRTIGFFNDPLDTWLDSYDGDGAISRKVIYLSIPEGTPICTQQIRVIAIDKTAVTEGETIGFQTFTIEVLKKGLF